MIKDIGFIIYAVSDMKKSRAFYEEVLGLVLSGEFDKTEDSPWVEYNVGSGCFALGRSDDWKPSQDGATVAFEVDDFDSFVIGLKGKGVVFKLEQQDFPTCKMCVIKDPDLNNILIHHKK